MPQAETGLIIAPLVADATYWIFLALLILNLLQRRHQQTARRKRLATLYLALAMFALFVVAQAVETYGGADWYVPAAAALIAAAVYYFRDHTWPFSVYAQDGSGRRLSWNEILYDDSNGAGNA
jgi:ABC-type xylose transport system permease subunit